ncbi:aryldialkylphosphatase [Microbacterium paraoxydans]|uniref:phosphotriesterase family protein n=1 Tax=Microbacterium TaxID=33882 RepID=UPI002285CD88|nr:MULTISPECIES: aryldialkylphosphatase [Microbacterium]MCZ0710030.1 aryldialkylphosphatase [Microbacterium paraoxydans]MDH5132441.1 aryldialkylphosphatase [Microbacterium sp. RD10]MDH5137063.1 aryldialkylphosphatase [Microbacterium sp. RD11]MDH5144896.1 aryldialkylphosphatase [Microbacterium sp. RD12]MDH5154369.1 aryldialkylphosphatase [Microbacterium sp. RD06]
MPAVRTVLGDIDPSQLGRVDYHEHLFQVSPLLVGDELDDEAASGEEAGLLRASGFEAMADATPFGLGRDPAAVARISAATGLHVVATTGRHREAHYGPDHPMQVWGADRLAALFVSDLTRGMPADDAAVFETPDVPLAAGPGGEPVRAGMLKGGADYWRISPFERTTLVAVARAHRETGAPVMVHLEFGTAAHEVLDLLEAEGVAADRVVLAHADRDPDPGLHVSLAERGAHLGYDGFARPRTRSDAELLALTVAVVERGAGDRILLGGDVARRTRYIAYGGMPGLAYLGDRYLPRLREAVGDDAVHRMLVTTPARFLTLRP